jgi:hypothetical protein
LRQSLAIKTTRDEHSPTTGNKVAAAEAVHHDISEVSRAQSSTQQAAMSSGCTETADVDNDLQLTGNHPDAAFISTRVSSATSASSDGAAAEVSAKDRCGIADDEVVFPSALSSASTSDCDKPTASCDRAPDVGGAAVGHVDGTDRDSGIGSPTRITTMGLAEDECKIDRERVVAV